MLLNPLGVSFQVVSCQGQPGGGGAVEDVTLIWASGEATIGD